MKTLLQSLILYGTGMAVRGLEVFGKFGLYMLAARTLGIQESGLFFLCLTWVGLASTVARMGLERALTRHIAAELAVGNVAMARADLIQGLLWTMASACLLGLLTYGFADSVADYLFSEPALAWPLKLSALAIPAMTLAVVAGGALSGLHRGVMTQLVQNALWPVLTLLALVTTVNTLDNLIIAMIAAMLVSGLLGAAAIMRSFPSSTAATAQPLEKTEEERLPYLWKTAAPLAVVEIIQVSIGSLPMLALGIFASPTAVGAFSIANRISMLIWVVILSVGAIAAPSFAACHRKGEIAALRAINRQTRFVIMLFGLPAIAIMMLFPSTLLGLVGSGFDIASTALVIMAAGQLVNCLLPCQDIVLAMTGHGATLRVLNLAQFATCVILGSILLPQFGAEGAALVTAICIAQGAIGTTLMLRRLMPGAF